MNRSPAGQLTIVAGNGTYGSPTDGPATSSELEGPTGVAVDGAGDLYITDGDGDGDVSEVTPDGQLTVIAGNGTGGPPTYGVDATQSSLDYPWDVASTPAGRLYVTDSGNSTVDLLVPVAAPVNTVAPTTSGSATAGQTLTASEGSWNNVPIIYSYQWQDCDSSGSGCTDISGATTSTYTPTASDAGHTLRVLVTAANGAGSTTADSPVTALVVSPPTTTTTSTTTPTATAVDETTAASRVTGLSAGLNGVVAGSSGAVSYRFAYGASRQYGQLTALTAVAASDVPQTVSAKIRHLVPGRVYHYRLEVINSAGTVSYAADKTLRTPKLLPRRVRDHIYSYWNQTAPYSYRVAGRIILPHGLSKKVAYQSHSKATVTATLNGTKIARHTVRVAKAGTYTSTFTFTNLTGSGRIRFHMRFTGDHQLRARQARTLNVLYGPDAKRHS
jgi:hypothetical protein